ncbi:hypothetical protein D3C75_771250 [compost metagenome]
MSCPVTGTSPTRWCGRSLNRRGTSLCNLIRGCASPICSKQRWAAVSRACIARAKTLPRAIRIPSTSPPLCRPWSAWWCRIFSSTKPPSSPMCSCRAVRSWKKTAPSPTPSGVSRGYAKSWTRWAARPTGKARWPWPMPWVTRCTTNTHRKSWMKSPA